MDIKTIGVEDWLNVWEKSATYDIAQSTIASMTMGEILQLSLIHISEPTRRS